MNEESVQKIESIVATITNVYFGEEIYKTTEEKALAYLFFLIKDHPFIDGNKRTACLVFEIVCNINNIKPNYNHYKLDEIAIFIEKIDEPDHHNVIRVLSELIFKK